jgi:hypothetical protein
MASLPTQETVTEGLLWTPYFFLTAMPPPHLAGFRQNNVYNFNVPGIYYNGLTSSAHVSLLLVFDYLNER